MLPRSATGVPLQKHRLTPQYNRDVRKVKINDFDSSERHTAARYFRHRPQYMVHAGVEKCWDKNTSMTHPSINCEVVRNGAITPHRTLCTRIQVNGYQVDELRGIARRARFLQSTSRFTESNASRRSIYAATSPVRKSRRR